MPSETIVISHSLSLMYTLRRLREPPLYKSMFPRRRNEVTHLPRLPCTQAWSRCSPHSSLTAERPGSLTAKGFLGWSEPTLPLHWAGRSTSHPEVPTEFVINTSPLASPVGELWGACCLQFPRGSHGDLCSRCPQWHH